MISGTHVPLRKRFLLSLLSTTLLVMWGLVPVSEAGYQSNFFMSDNGTGYFGVRDDGAVGDPARVTTLGLGASTAGVSGSTTSTQGDPLQADVSITPLFSAASVRHTGIFDGGCALPGVFNPAANSGNGQWTVPGLGGDGSIDGFGDVAQLPNVLSTGGGGIPAATAVANRYRFGAAGPTTSIAKGAAFPADGFSMDVGECVVFVLDSSSLLLPGTTLSGAGAVAGFLAQPAPGNTECATGTACATAAKQDNDSTFLPTTTTTSTTTTSTTTTTTTSTTSTTTTSSTTTTTIPVKIPTAGNWGLLILSLALLGGIAWMLQARRALR